MPYSSYASFGPNSSLTPDSSPVCCDTPGCARGLCDIVQYTSTGATWADVHRDMQYCLSYSCAPHGMTSYLANSATVKIWDVKYGFNSASGYYWGQANWCCPGTCWPDCCCIDGTRTALTGHGSTLQKAKIDLHRKYQVWVRQGYQFTQEPETVSSNSLCSSWSSTPGIPIYAPLYEYERHQLESLPPDNISFMNFHDPPDTTGGTNVTPTVTYNSAGVPRIWYICSWAPTGGFLGKYNCYFLGLGGINPQTPKPVSTCVYEVTRNMCKVVNSPTCYTMSSFNPPPPSPNCSASSFSLPGPIVGECCIPLDKTVHVSNPLGLNKVHIDKVTLPAGMQVQIQGNGCQIPGSCAQSAWIRFWWPFPIPTKRNVYKIPGYAIEGKCNAITQFNVKLHVNCNSSSSTINGSVVPVCYIPPISSAVCCIGSSCHPNTYKAPCEMAGGTWKWPIQSCNPNPCLPDPKGACCYYGANQTQGACFFTTPNWCSMIGGHFKGYGTQCVKHPLGHYILCDNPPSLSSCSSCSSPSPPVIGACCLKLHTETYRQGSKWLIGRPPSSSYSATFVDVCVETDEQTCIIHSGQYQGDRTECSPTTCNAYICCKNDTYKPIFQLGETAIKADDNLWEFFNIAYRPFGYRVVELYDPLFNHANPSCSNSPGPMPSPLIAAPMTAASLTAYDDDDDDDEGEDDEGWVFVPNFVDPTNNNTWLAIYQSRSNKWGQYTAYRRRHSTGGTYVPNWKHSGIRHKGGPWTRNSWVRNGWHSWGFPPVTLDPCAGKPKVWCIVKGLCRVGGWGRVPCKLTGKKTMPNGQVICTRICPDPDLIALCCNAVPTIHVTVGPPKKSNLCWARSALICKMDGDWKTNPSCHSSPSCCPPPCSSSRGGVVWPSDTLQAECCVPMSHTRWVTANCIKSIRGFTSNPNINFAGQVSSDRRSAWMKFTWTFPTIVNDPTNSIRVVLTDCCDDVFAADFPIFISCPSSSSSYYSGVLYPTVVCRGSTTQAPPPCDDPPNCGPSECVPLPTNIPHTLNTCLPDGECGAEYRTPTPGTKKIRLRVPRFYSDEEVRGKWLVLEGKCPEEPHKYYQIIKAVCSSATGGTP